MPLFRTDANLNAMLQLVITPELAAAAPCPGLELDAVLEKLLEQPGRLAQPAIDGGPTAKVT